MTDDEEVAAERFGRWLRESREWAGLSIRAAAKEAAVSEGLWRQLELGYRQVAAGVRVPSNPRASTVKAVAKAVRRDPIEALRLAGHTGAAELERSGVAVTPDADIHLIGLPPEGAAALSNDDLLAELARRLRAAEREETPDAPAMKPETIDAGAKAVVDREGNSTSCGGDRLVEAAAADAYATAAREGEDDRPPPPGDEGA
jgi:hypothetical protein